MKFKINKINVAVLAGGVSAVSLFEGYTPGYKCLIPLEGRPMIQFVLDAIGEVSQVGRICIVGPEKIRGAIEHPARYEYAPEGNSLGESIFNGLRYFSDSPVVLLVPADLPLITPFSVIDFLKNCEGMETSYEAAILWAMIPEESFTGPFFKITKGYNRFRDVAVCHGNLLLMTPSILKNQKIVSRINAVYEVRKSSANAAMAVGLFVGAVYAVGVHFLRAMTLKQTARILSRHIAVEMVPVLLDRPEVAVDIDTPEDYVFAQEQISLQKGDWVPAG
jgi:molybdopterin-guanine dinucleotide biosynthesis protein A